MSLALLKESLEIVEQDLPKDSKAKTQATKISKQNKKKSKRNIEGIEKKDEELKFLQKKKRKIEDIRQDMSQSKNLAKENLRKLLALSKNPVKVKEAEQIFKRAHKGRYIEKAIPKVKKEQESIFTEEDFKAFEAEYFNS